MVPESSCPRRRAGFDSAFDLDDCAAPECALRVELNHAYSDFSSFHSELQR